MMKEWTAKWIGLQDEDHFNPVFFKDFQVDFPIRKATFYITALGVFEAYVNGRRVCDEYLTPYRKNDDGTLQYFAYDVTDLLYTGPESASNSIDVFLGQGWDEENERIALRAEIVLEPSDEEAEEALAMEWDEVEAEPGEYEELIDSYDIETLLEDDQTDGVLPDDTDSFLDELLGDAADEGFPDVSDDVLNGATGIISKTGEYHEAKHARKRQFSLVRDPFMEEAEELLADEEPEMVFVSVDGPGTVEEVFADQQALYNQQVTEEEEFVFLDDPYEIEPYEGKQIPKSAPEPDKSASFGNFPVQGQRDNQLTEETIQQILAEQERQLASFVPSFVDEEKQLDDILADVVDDFSFEDELPEDVDGLANAIAAEISGDYSELTPQERAWYDDIDGQVSFDFAEQEESQGDAPQAEAALEDDFLDDEFDSLLDEMIGDESQPEEVIEEATEEAEEAIEEVAVEAEEVIEEAAVEPEEVIEETIEEFLEEEPAFEEAAEEEIAVAIEEALAEETEAEEQPEDAPVITIGTDETWGYYASDIQSNRIEGFEIFDRTLWIGKENPDKDAIILDLDIPLTERQSAPMFTREELPVQSILPAEDGEGSVLDFGQSFTGFVSFQSDLSEGKKVTFSFSEDPGSFTENENTFVYVSDGISELVSPHFALFTGRYVKLTGWDGQPDPALFTGYVLSDTDEVAKAETEETAGIEEAAVEETVETAEAEEIAEELPEVAESVEDSEDIPEDMAEEPEALPKQEYGQCGFVETSEGSLNAIAAENIAAAEGLIGELKNFLKKTEPAATEEPAETPETEEAQTEKEQEVQIKTADLCANIRTICYSANAKEVLMQYFRELRKAQIANEKAIPAYIPNDGNTSRCCIHSGEAVKGIWTLYEMYGDPAILEENYDLIKDVVSYVSKEDSEERYLIPCKGIKGEETEGSFITTVYYYESAKIGAQAAATLNREDDRERFETLSEKIKEAFLDEYFTRSGRMAEDTQTAYVLALRSGLYEDKEKLMEDFRKRLKKDCYQIKCGPIGRNDLSMVLADCGECELAYRFLMDADDTADGNNERAAEFLFSYVNGIRALEPGFEKILISPHPDSRLIYSACDYQSPKGVIQSDWEVTEDGMLKMHIEIPEGTQAKVLMPDCSEDSLKEQLLSGGIYDFTYQPTKDYLHLFHDNSLAGDILKYAESLAIVEEVDPSLAEQLQNAGPELLTKTLDELTDDPEKRSAIKEKLFQLF